MDFLIFFIALSVLILVHELGHYLAARASGVRVDEFGLGLPPRIVGKKKWGTVWSLNWLPVGGFCKLFGEDNSEKGASSSKESFVTKNPWQKGLIVIGGVTMNLVLAIIIFAISYSITGVPKESGRVRVVEVAKNSPAERAGISSDDIVLKVGDKEVKKAEEMTAEVGKRKGEKIGLTVEREGQRQDLSVDIRKEAPAGEGLLGVVINSSEVEKIKWYQFYKGVGAGFREAYYWGKVIIEGLGKMIGGLFVGEIPKDVAGPIGMFKATQTIRAQQGFLALVHFLGIISVNLAVVNILPFPALDGGRIIFVVYELITKKRANQKLEMTVNNIGMLILLSLIVLITIGDIKHLILGK